ncbi:hypothetical protein ACQ4PT_064532 [Festuca glaucescens]
MEPAASAAAEGAPQGERAEVAGPILGKDAAQGPGCLRGGGGRKEGEEEVPLRLRLGRARRRAGPGTPAPSWKLEGSPGSPEREGEVEMAAAAPAPRRSSASASASARQLGASLWEIHDVAREGRRSEGRRRRSGNGLAGVGAQVDKPQNSGGFDRNLTDLSKDLRKLHQERSHAAQPFSPASYTSSTRGSNIDRAINLGRALDVKGRSRVAGYNLNTSTELLKVLNRIWCLEEQQTANMSVVKGLKLELQQAQAHIQELKQERRGYRHEVASLMRQLSEDKLVRKNKNQEKIEGALCSLQDEVEDERHLRWHSEDLHRKSGRELSEVKPAFLKALKDLEKEKKTNRLLEGLCDQFALGIRNYEEEVSMLKQRHGNIYEHKFDKSVLHISEAWLDERMQMQNIVVQEDSLQKATVTERLSSEIKAFLLAETSASSKNNVKCMNDTRRDSSLRRQSLESVHLNGTTSAPQVAEDDDDDSVASDLHCFELNMHGNGNRNHYHTGSHRRRTASIDEPKRISGYSYSTAGESSHRSHMPLYAQKDKARSSSSNPHYVTSVLEINSHSSAGIALAEVLNEVSYTNKSRGSHIDSLNHNLEDRPADCLGQESLDHYSRTSLFCAGTNSGDLCNPHSPTRQLNYQSTPSGHEIFECSPELPVGVKENTLKAKLLQARLEGRHARLKASGGSLSSRRK